MPYKKDTIKIINDFLNDDNTTKKVLVLKGSWGTGKTWLWKNEIVPPQPISKKIGYVSLFGKSNIQEINKSALSAVYLANKASKITHKARQFTNALNTATENFSKFNTAVQGIDALLSVINRENLENTIICFDDLERMDKNIDFQDFLGFVNDLAENQECKVVLIFNEDELFKKQNNETIENNENNINTLNNNENKNTEQDNIKKENIYNKFKEKTIDIEVTYTPTFEDNFELACNIIKPNIDEKYIYIAKNVLKELNENNIRIIKKCIECINDFIHAVENIKDKIKKYNDFSNTILINIIKSITFITQQYWKAGHRFWENSYIENKTKELNDKKFLSVIKELHNDYYIYQGKYLEVLGKYFQGFNFDENILVSYFKNYELLITYNKVEILKTKYAEKFWYTIDGKRVDYINKMCELFKNDANAYSYFINKYFYFFTDIITSDSILNTSDKFKDIFYKQINNAIDRYLEEFQNNFTMEYDFEIYRKIESINPSKLKFLYKMPNNADDYYHLLINILRSEHLESSIYLIEKIEYDKYVKFCNENDDFFLYSKSFFFERNNHDIATNIPHFLYITAKYLLYTIEINPDNEMKYDEFGKSRIGKDDNNYSAKEDLEKYVASYENNNKKSN